MTESQQGEPHEGMSGHGKRDPTYRAISRLWFIPVVGREMMQPAEDVLVGYTCQAGRRVGPVDESGGRGGLGCLAGMGRAGAGGGERL